MNTQRKRLSTPRKSFLGVALVLIGMALCLIPQHASAKTHHVLISNMKFTPEALVVKKGDTIEWKNDDLVPHTVTASPSSSAKKPAFDSGTINGSQTFKYKAVRVGEFPYICRFHPTMKAKIVVQK